MNALAGRSALVTGASAGLGEAIAGELTRRGARILMCSRSPERLRAAADRMAGAEPPLFLAGDLTDPATAPRLTAEAQSQFGGLDMLVGIAGGPPPGDFAEMDDHAWGAAFNVILLSMVRLIRACRPLLRASPSGRIVLGSSISARRPVPRLVLSNTLRPALSGLARHLATELAPEGILINVIAPGFFATQRATEVQVAMAEARGESPDQVRAAVLAGIPLGRQGDPPEFGHLAAFLLGAENGYITGQTIAIDGGLTAS